jgi:hypothetical protein
VNWGTHQWAAERAKVILFYDGYTRYATLLQSPIRIGSTGIGQRHISVLINCVISAYTLLNGCKPYGRSIGWPLGDHMLNPYRHFGLYSYNQYPSATGWHGWAYPRSGECANAPRVRSNSAAMADEFFRRAQREWLAFQPGNAMFNLGIALHVMQDATVPSHVHPESVSRDHFPPASGVVQDNYPAWAAANRARYGVDEGGYYQLPRTSSGVTIANSAGGWVYWMASRSYPYFPFQRNFSAIPQSRYGCDVTSSPEACPGVSRQLMYDLQRGSAGFLRYFFASVGYSAR